MGLDHGNGVEYFGATLRGCTVDVPGSLSWGEGGVSLCDELEVVVVRGGIAGPE